MIAPFRFPVNKSDEELGRERAEAASAVSPIFDLRPDLVDSLVARSGAFFDSIAAAVADTALGESEIEAAIGAVLEGYRLPASEGRAALLRSAQLRDQLASAMERAFRDLLRPGVAAAGELDSFAGRGVILREGEEQRLVPRDSLPTMQGFFERAKSRVPRGFGVAELTLFQNLVIRFGEPTIRLNPEATEIARDQARQAVDRVKYEVLRDERIVSAHERVGPAEIERLESLRRAMAQQGTGSVWRARMGALVYNLLLLVVLGLVLRYFRPSVYESERSLTLIWALLIAVAVAAALIWRAGWPAQLIPVAFAALLVATLYDGLLSLVTVFVLVGLVAARPLLAGTAALFPALVGGAAAALSGRMVRRRAHTWPLAAVIAGAYVLAAVSWGLLGRQGTGWILQASVFGSLNAVVCVLLATGVLPLAESFTRITTDQTLLELVDLNRPLLRRLSLEAPGTYAHSINVANLAEAAAREIGANALLTRVGTYYHDIGKVKKPQFFVENQPRGRNPHDKLKPAMSASIVREHVKEGLVLADEARLPEAVKAFISEHHGTQRIGFFWEQAKEMSPEAEIDPDEFRYPGPKPQSKETAIVLLADSVESAARVLPDPTPDGIAELVDRIVGFKMSERQLDETPLTLREIHLIKQQFMKVLNGMYHSRLDYPLPTQETAGSETATREAS